MQKTILLLGLFFIFTVNIQAKELSQLEIYRRCSIHLSGMPPVFNGQIENQIKRGEVKAVDACLQLLNLGRLKTDGYLENKDNPLAKAVIKTLFLFHRTWFSANTLEQIQDYNEEVARGTLDVYDPNEPALTLTRSLLNPDVKYSEVLTSDKGVSAIREENLAVKNKFNFKFTIPSRRVYGNDFVTDKNLTSFRNQDDDWIRIAGQRKPSDLQLMPTVQVGDLVGISTETKTFQVPNIDLQPLGISTPGHKQPELNYQFDFFKSEGGGVLGSHVFFLMNYGHPFNLKSNGSTKLPRRWIRSAMESLLCSQFPALRESDVKSYVVGNSSAPFRNGTSCVQCHATLDQAASTGRNLIMGATDFFAFDENYINKYPLVVASYKGAQTPAAGWPSEPVKDFHLQKPTGQLFFRSATGKLISKPVNDIASLGKAMSDTDDFYLCAAKRYFEYFTGINVSLYDKTDPVNAALNKALTEQHKNDRIYIEKLAADLQKSQSLNQLIKAIISSSYYQNSNFRADSQ